MVAEKAVRYLDVLRAIYSRGGKSSYYTLSRVEEAAEGVGSPHLRFPAVHIGGTNGKGSVAVTVAEALRREGYKVGLYTSPHMHRYTERIRINGKEIHRREVVRRFHQIEELIMSGRIPWITFFEITTLIAFGWFADSGVDVAVVEVGLGGRLDATNICRSVVNAIVTVDLDHCHVLGYSVDGIAREKAGIIKGRAQVVCGEMSSEAQQVIAERARKFNCDLWLSGQDFRHESKSDGFFDYHGRKRVVENLRVAMKGVHQVENAAVSCAVVEACGGAGFVVSDDSIRGALGSVKWVGRLERISKKPEIILDCAHNPAALKKLVRSLSGRKFHLVFGALSDKPIEQMYEIVTSLSYSSYICSPNVHRKCRAEEIASRCGGKPYSTVGDALDAAVSDARRTGLGVLVTGSIFVVSEARAHYLKLRNVDPPIAM